MKYLVKFRIGSRHFKMEVEGYNETSAERNFFGEITVLKIEKVEEPDPGKPDIMDFLNGFKGKRK